MKRGDAPRPVDLDKPGMGQFYCLCCAKYFINEDAMQKHVKSKVHKQRLKIVAEPQYTQQEAEAAAGMAPAI